MINLVLAALLGHTQRAVDGLDLVVVDDGLVHEVEAQARHAVKHRLHVLLATYGLQHVCGDLLVVSHGFPSRLVSLGRTPLRLSL